MFQQFQNLLGNFFFTEGTNLFIIQEYVHKFFPRRKRLNVCLMTFVFSKSINYDQNIFSGDVITWIDTLDENLTSPSSVSF